ncbi:MAG: arginine--tRNA ligase [Chloroflexi bacterium]|nr:arginine--tRNA ligase [Chloroflexota bacterium]MCL5274171.1 arginine--tRNA ligase [Chloroflexota bacterium]
MIREQLKRRITQAIRDAQAAGELPQFDLPPFTVEHPRQAQLGDYSASVAMQLARAARMPPAQIAQRIAGHLSLDGMATVDDAGAYLNFRLSPQYLSGEVDKILASGDSWGNIDIGAGKTVQVEHGSANPTGPLTVASGRNVVIGDTLANALSAAGFTVQREWYVNDAGNQIRHFGESVYARYAQSLGVDEPFPEDGYKGDYIVEIAKAIIAQAGDKYLKMPRDEARRALGKLGIDSIMDGVRASLARVGIHHDSFFSERSLYESGQFERVLPILRNKGLLVEYDDALWFSEDGSPIRKGETRGEKQEDDSQKPEVRSQKIENGGAGKEAVQVVVIRSPKVVAEPSERPTYFASDIAYVWNKLVDRRFDRAIYVWGEDHQGDVPRLMAVTRALGLDTDRIVLLIYRFITLMRNGQEVRMGKRSGNIITLDDVVDEVGADATRFVLLSRSIDTKIVFDLDLVKKQSDENPVYYVQYAHARICSILRKAAEEIGDKRLEISAGATNTISNLQSPISSYIFSHPSELALIRKLLELEEVVEQVATQLQPHHFATYAQSLATTFSAFYRDCRVLGEAPEVSAARMKLVQAARTTLARTLALMGMSAPERM